MTQTRPHRPRKLSFDLFTAIWNLQQNQDTPQIHWRIVRWLARESRGASRRLLLMAFRGCGKSTLTGLFCAWRLCQDPDMRILILSADEALAENMLRHVRHILETHPVAAPLIPKKKQLWSADRLLIDRNTVGRDPSVRAAGVHSTITGARADLIICDDVEVPNTCDTVHKRAQLRDALRELDFILTPQGTILYIGTPHAEDSLYAPDGYLAHYTRLALPLTGDAWPERFSPDAVALMRKTVGPRVFQSQMLLQPTRMADARLDPDRLRAYEAVPHFVMRACYWDPAFGHEKGDQSVVVLAGIDLAQNVHIDALLVLPKAPREGDAARVQCGLVCDFICAQDLSRITVETNGLGQFLPGMLRTRLRERGHRCSVIEHHATIQKNKRILHAFEARLAAGALYVNKNVLAGTHLAEQMRDWQPDHNNNRDDLLDACAGAIALLVPRRHINTTYFLKTDSSHDT